MAACPGVPHAAVAGLVVQTTAHVNDASGIITGHDTLNLMGQYFPRDLQGTFTLASTCRGTGVYTDSLGNVIHFVLTAVNDGDTLFLQGSDPGAAISGVAQRVW